MQAQPAADKASKRIDSRRADKDSTGSAKKRKRSGRPAHADPLPQDPISVQTGEAAGGISHPLRVGPALQQASSLSLDWAALQVLQDNTLLLASLVRLQCADACRGLDARRSSALELAQQVERRYSGANDTRAIRDPCQELRGLWDQLVEGPRLSPLAMPTVEHAADSARVSSSPRARNAGATTQSSASVDGSAAHARSSTSPRASTTDTRPSSSTSVRRQNAGRCSHRSVSPFPFVDATNCLAFSTRPSHAMQSFSPQPRVLSRCKVTSFAEQKRAKRPSLGADSCTSERAVEAGPQVRD
ncbi:uncharacterized protein SRS1_10754 [Sporisorium reilianum f. sp. reilianum]|uniref:Uncharacterized protein n=1 Tax=Sporisorium reilianum f. sp. reilianum TaxID=72559 RepID=A0A2N8UCY0_9BASI|nr:uncharacterized protein SRS1_10754 [Sporisorium reilianum f. sp. reilianum]